ncbi:hypothetical protein THMIRHAS_17740 [Thiosulfatimonas sediminis]|uniref:Uncharacterized protein n=1 Tax=Thiosulfatimonas sediminis TaxID=2675054 RepID=A0A6F8PW97_9GAMM|nr:hypothetical protein THMIRHAS_17740 [Thiosulfatimonas sediminis]
MENLIWVCGKVVSVRLSLIVILSVPASDLRPLAADRPYVTESLQNRTAFKNQFVEQ